MQTEPKPWKKNSVFPAARLLVLCLLVLATKSFGLNFNVTLGSLTNHNTSAFPSYNCSSIPANFGPTTAVDTVSDTYLINSNLMDMSLNPITPGHVSHVNVHTLIPSRPELRWFANGTCWWGKSSHIDIGVNDNTDAQVAAEISDLESRGFDGIIFSWYGQGSFEDSVALKVQQYLHSSSNTNKNFKMMIMIVFGNFAGQEGVPNLEANINYCQSQYFSDTNYECEPVNGGKPLLMFFNVYNYNSDYDSAAKMLAIKNATTGSSALWVQENTGSMGAAWVDQAYLWTDDYTGGIKDSGFFTDPFNLHTATNQFATIKANNTKQAFGAMCAHFNGTLTKKTSWSLGKFLQSSNGLCEVTRAAAYNKMMPANMTRMQWATWSDWEEGTEVMSGTENNFALNPAMSSTNVLAWTITSGYEATIDHYDIYAQTNGGDAAWLCAVTNGVHQVNVGQFLSTGSYQLYVNAVAKPCIRDHMSVPTAYVATGGLPFPWNNEDIGSVGTNGSAAYTNGTFTVAGSGFDIWGSSDSFQYVYQPWTGNGQIVAEVNSITDTAPYAKAALMFRSTLDANSANGIIFVSPAQGVLMQSRTSTGGSTATIGTTPGTTPGWISLILSNNVLTGYSSPDGLNWTPVGTNLISLGSSLYVGMAVTSKSNPALNTSTFSNVTVSSVASAKATLQSDLQPIFQTVWQSAPVSFTVVGGGLGALQYQWMLNGQGISGATNASYSFGALAGTNYYSVTLSNSLGSVNSSTAEVVGVTGTFLSDTNNYYGTQITFNGDTNGGSLQDFPVLVRLSTNVPGFSYAQFVAPGNGADLRFTDASGTRMIPFEIDEWNTGGVSTVWVQVPVLSTNASIWAYWGKAAPAAALPSTNVWVPQPWESLPAFDVVYHLKESGFPYADSTGQNPALTGGAPVPTNGLFGIGESFAAASYLDAGTINLGNAFTLSAWVDLATNAGNIQAVWASKGGSSSNGFAFYVNTYSASGASDHKLLLETSDHASTPTYATTSPCVSSNQWHQLVAVVNRAGGSAQLYVDGALIAASGTVLTDFNTNQDVRLGEFQGNAFPFNGLMDEARIQSGLSSSNWVWASYMTVAANSAFENYSAVSYPVVTLSIQYSGGNLILAWPVGTLQSAGVVTGPYSDVSGATSPYTNSVSGTQQFYRVKVR